MKNICFFNSLKSWGGGEKFYLENAVGFKKKGYNVVVACDDHSILSQKIFLHHLPKLSVNNVKNLSFLNPYRIFKVYSLLKKNKIDTLIFSTSQDLKLGGIAAKLAGVNKIIYRRGLAHPIKGNFLNKYLLKHVTTHIFANSEETKRTIRENLRSQIPENKITVLYNGIKTTKVDTETQLEEIKRSNPKEIILGNAGRLSKQKGQKLLLDLADVLKEKKISFKLYIAGTGELKKELEKEIKKRNLQEEVILIGFVKNIDAFMNSIDVFLLSSIWEGFGYVLVEAMMHSKPVVAFNITSNPEIVIHDKTGFLVDYPNMDAFARQTLNLIESSQLRKKMGENGLARVKEEFDLEDSISRLEHYLLQ
ncbi:MAG: glycosyltransferase [Cyclobacteriaceae bacterium]|jgi:glycosyltransferase involved in cell wall biosynthesis|tara:strand:- start:709 stop:1800 length:1092 start_codon:yes stop_codon:yes gene_type:complete